MATQAKQTLFAYRLERLLRGKDMNLSELARKAGVPKQALSRILRSETSPKWETAVKLANALGVTAAAFH